MKHLSSIFFLTVTALFPIFQSQILAAQPEIKIDEVAKPITAQIEGKSHGSGVIIQHKGTTYTVLSAAHVFDAQTQYTVLTADGQHHLLLASSIKRLPKVDLATVQFSSSQTYSVAQLGNSAQIVRKAPCYIAGYTADRKNGAPIYHFSKGTIEANAAHPIDKGYALAYFTNTLPGMSGGPVLDNQGHLIGIQGFSLLPPPIARAINPLGNQQNRFYMAIPIDTFIKPNSLVPKTLTADDYLIRGNFHYTQSEQSAALADYSNAIRLAPDDAPAYYGRANLRAGMGDIKGAFADYSQALALNPDYTLAYYYRGGIYAEQGSLEKARADYDQSLNRDPSLAVAYNNRGTVRYRLGDANGAVLDYGLALQQNPKFRDAYANRGLARYGLGDYQGALKDYGQAIHLDPVSASTYRSRGTVYAALKDLQSARTDLQKAAELYRNQENQEQYEAVLRQIEQLKS